MPNLSIDGHDMAYIEQGAGEPLVLVHGSLNDYRYWAPQMDALAAAGFRTIAVSLRHYWPERWDGTGGGFTTDRHVADMAAFIAALGAGPVHLVGHSRGGYIAFRVAERHPRRVRRLVLAEPAGVLDASLLPPGAVPAVYTAFIADAVERVRQGDVEEGLRRFYEYAIGPGAWDRLPGERQQICRDNALTLLGQMSEGRKPYARAAAEAIGAPTLLVGGELTRPAFATVLDGLAPAIPSAQRVTIPGASHVMNWDNPAAFNAAVLEFLRA
jgi:pimeloyl-ACP methyl ester carboxylesterase